MMKPKLFTAEWILCIALLILLFSLSSCKPEEQAPPVVYPSVCGDGVCSSNELVTCDIDCNLNVEAEPVLKTPADVLEDLRSRIRNYSAAERLKQVNPYVVSDNKILVESFTSYLPETGFRVASRYNLLSIGENVSDVIGVLNAFHLRDVLRGGVVRSSTEAFGPRAANYAQFLKLRTGKVVFGYEEESELVTTYLLFKEGEPILDYLLELQGGIFKFFERQKIQLLGHEYFIEEVTNNSMRLLGVSTPDTLLFRNQHGVWINNKPISGEVINVSFGKDYLRVVLLADEDIRIIPGTGLRSYLEKPEVLLTNRLDIDYEGLTEVPIFDIKFDKTREKYKLSFVTQRNLSYNIPLAYLSPFKAGDEEYNLVFQEGSNKSDYFVKKKDYFVISNNKEYNGLTNILRLVSIDDESHLILFEDPSLEKFYVYFEGKPGVNATADLIVYNVLHKVYVGANESISIDLNGNGRISNDNVPIITAGNGIIRINRADKEAMNISVITPKQMRENAKSDLKVDVIITQDGLSIDKQYLEMLQEPGKELLTGMTDYGALFLLKGGVDEDDQSGEDLTIKYPLVQRFADVIVKAYE
jgi:hypothetical protein